MADCFLYPVLLFVSPLHVVSLYIISKCFGKVAWYIFQSIFPFVVQVEKMKEIAKIKAKEERRKLESEVRNIETEFGDY